MKRVYKKYSEEERLSLLRSYHESGLSKHCFCKSYGLSCVGLLDQWLHQYEPAEKDVSLPREEIPRDMLSEDTPIPSDETAQLKIRIRELEKALSYSKLETEIRDIMIEKAESYFGIPIRKKSGARQ